NVGGRHNAIRRGVKLGEDEAFAVDETWLRWDAAENPVGPRTLDGALVRQEKEMIEAGLAESQGGISGPAGAAAKLGLPAETLESKIKRLKINKYRFKAPQTD